MGCHLGMGMLRQKNSWNCTKNIEFTALLCALWGSIGEKNIPTYVNNEFTVNGVITYETCEGAEVARRWLPAADIRHAMVGDLEAAPRNRDAAGKRELAPGPQKNVRREK